MATVVPPTPTEVDAHALEQWHNIFKPPWETLVSIKYVDAAEKRMWTEEIVGLEQGDGEVQFFGEDVLEPELHNATLTSNVTFYAVSLSASDTSILRCWMINAAGAETVVDCVLDGTTPCPIGSYVHCNMAMYLGGAVQNVGSLFVSTKSDAGTPLVITNQVQLHVGVSRGHGNNPRQKCPNDQMFIFDDINVTADKQDGVHVRMHVWRKLGTATPHKMLNAQWIVYQTDMQAHFAIPFSLVAGEEIDLTVQRDAAGSAVSAAANWGMYVIKSSPPAQKTRGSGELFDE